MKTIKPKTKEVLRREPSSDCLVCSRFQVDYFDDITKEFWFDRRYYAKIGNITIQSENEQELRDFIKQLEIKIYL